MSRFVAVLTASVPLPLAHVAAQRHGDSPTALAQQLSSGQEAAQPKRLELSFGWWLPNPAARLGIGWYLGHFVQLEPSVTVAPDEAVFSLNISPNFVAGGAARSRVIPYVTAGVGVCVHETPILNGGGGLKIRLGETLGFRADLIYYWFEEEGSVTDGVAWFVGVTSFF
ncbi:MAG: hypothetical protein AMS18_16250 [Gemmatimonas sp. SG8_17]|nr:MAG: hypothetical protein AMS18_16250 [Gemmatimonas sp. SG8_17]